MHHDRARIAAAAAISTELAHRRHSRGTRRRKGVTHRARRAGHAAFAGSTLALDAYLDKGNLPGRIAAPETPATLVFGMRDQRVDPSGIDNFVGVTIERLPASGHTPHLGGAERTAALIRTAARPAR
jgi:pimeloyl-ACP methyl ester carboxylesterase